tara:strand:- start:372 stop:968 length:597 start_codon:yes stop_codon:yes gene_type:complete
MVNYQNAIIYKLCCKDTNVKEIYVGSTSNFKARKHQHKECCNNINSKSHYYYKYKFIRDNGGWDNWVMIQIKTFPCDSKRELESEERKVIEELNPQLNIRVPTRTKKEWENDNKEIISIKKKEYYLKNIEHKKEYDKQYRLKNKEYLDKKKKEWYSKNKEIINEKNKVKYTCKCDSVCRISDKRRHEQTKKHQNFIND